MQETRSLDRPPALRVVNKTAFRLGLDQALKLVLNADQVYAPTTAAGHWYCCCVPLRSLLLTSLSQNLAARQPSKKKQVLQLLRHPNIIHMEDVFESDAKIHMVMEIMQGGELFDYVVEKGTLSESEASVMVRKVSFAGKLPLLSTADGVVLRPSARASSS